MPAFTAASLVFLTLRFVVIHVHTDVFYAEIQTWSVKYLYITMITECLHLLAKIIIEDNGLYPQHLLVFTLIMAIIIFILPFNFL